ncbi:MAG: fimbrillin family protein, partial [Bacteroidales bacterium]|nr:fimbrillin family protein [Bacteroidales bacterium]
FMASAVAAVALLTGCSTENDFENGKDGLASLELSSVSSSDMLTRAVIDGEDFPTDKGNIGLFLFANAAASQTYGDGYANVDYSYNSQKGKWTASPSIKVGSTPGHLYGYYPYNSESTDVKEISVASSLNGDDVMYASKQVEPITDKTASSTSIVMNHALARVSITIKNNGYTGSAKLTSIKFAGAEIAESGTLNAVDGTITATKAQAVTLTVPEASQAIATGDGTTYECLLVPSAVKEDRQEVTLTLTIDGEPKTATLSGNDNGVIIAKGTKSNITIGLSNSGISVSSVSIDGWKEVEVGGHKVTVKVADDITAGDIMFAPYVDGNNVIIKASSFQSKRLICNVGGDAQCVRAITNDKFTFTISEISSDLEAVLGYATIVTLTVTSDSNGKVWIGDDKNKTSGQYEFGEQVVIHAAPNSNFKLFRWNDNNKELDRTITIGATDVTYSAKFISPDMIPGLFTVDANKKQVFFSKGNLYYNGATFNFEANQYDTTPSSSDARVGNHISHFMWCDDADNAMALKYESGWDGLNKTFFAGKNFTVNGYSGWGVLTGGSNGEWAYLLNTRETIYGKDTGVKNRRYAAVTVNGMAGLLIFPNDFSSWPSGAGTEPQTFNTNSSNWNDRNYTVEQFTVLQNNGCVFLPAAGYR